jgi:hypothetical protein
LYVIAVRQLVEFANSNKPLCFSSIFLTFAMPLTPSGTWQLLLGLGAASLFILYQTDRNRKHTADLFAITPSPLKTVLPYLSKSQLARLAYQPDHVPGARDVVTPFGCTRVYEFGPEDGQKVLLVHGISTPCLSLAGIARNLVAKGCRVMLYGA